MRTANPADAPQLAAIYNHYVLNTAISFEETAVPVDDFARRIQKVQDSGLPWLVAEVDGEIVGYAYAAKWRERNAYRFTVECTVYVAPAFTGRGVGLSLYQPLFARLRETGCHVVVAVIALPNGASVGLHERMGMTQVAHHREVGFKFGRWHDVGHWQLIL